MKRIVLATSLLLPLIGCADLNKLYNPQEAAFAEFTRVATARCGAVGIINVPQQKIVEHQECVGQVEKEILLPVLPYPDLRLEASAQQRRVGEKYQKGKISRQEFLSSLDEITANLIRQSQERNAQQAYQQQQYFQQQQTIQQQMQRQDQQQLLNSVPSRVKTTCTGQGNTITCESAPGGIAQPDLSVFGRICTVTDYQTGRCR